MSASVQRTRISRRARKLLLALSRRTNSGGLHGGVETMTMEHLEDSRRPLLFSLLPRMLRRDGSTPRSLQRTFRYSDGADRSSAIIVSTRRWNRALATSRRLAAGRATRREKP